MSDAAELPLRCACATVRGRALEPGPRRSLRLVCYCRDCQAFARYLGERGCPAPILDPWGGTEVVQLSPARIELQVGADKLACVRLSETGLMRWYADCCHTPIANTMAKAGVPFAGLITTFVDPDLNAEARDALLGPVRARVNGPAEGLGAGAPKIDRIAVGAIVRSLTRIAGSWRRNEHWPTPFYDADAQPRATPTVLSESERLALST